MPESHVLVFGEGRKRQTLPLPFTIAAGSRDVFLCANAERSAQLAAAAIGELPGPVVSTAWETKSRVRDVLSGLVAKDAGRIEAAVELLGVAGLEEPVLERRGRECSPVERFRVSLWLAAAARPALVVCDLASVGGSVFERADAFTRVRQFQQLGQFATIICISDPAYIATAGNRLSVFDGLDLVEHGDVATLLERPEHAYLAARLAATPLLDPRLQQRRRLLRADGIPATDTPLSLDLAQRRSTPRPDTTPLQAMPVVQQTMIIDLDEESSGA